MQPNTPAVHLEHPALGPRAGPLDAQSPGLPGESRVASRDPGDTESTPTRLYHNCGASETGRRPRAATEYLGNAIGGGLFNISGGLRELMARAEADLAADC